MLTLFAAMTTTASADTYYGLKVGGVDVKESNCNNITGSNIKAMYSSKEYWVRYTPSTKTLTLHNVSISRTGSYNRAILNESCEGLTIVFDGTCRLSARDASPVRLNASTTITGNIADNDLLPEINGQKQDALTIGDGATLTISDVRLWIDGKGMRDDYGRVTSDVSHGIVGNTGQEKVIIKNTDIYLKGSRGLKNIASLKVTDSWVNIEAYYGNEAAVENLVSLTLGANMMDIEGNYFSSAQKTFLKKSNGSVSNEVMLATYINIDATNFPDAIFRSFVRDSLDLDNDGLLNRRESYASEIDVHNMGITSLTGIEHFDYLGTLDCSQNQLTALNVTNLRYLETLRCFNNQLTSLNLKKNTQLKKLSCSNNQLTRLEITNNISLQSLSANSNKLTFIDFSENPALNYINISHNRIDAFMTETLESLCRTADGVIVVSDNDDSTSDNVCTKEQAEIAKQKGWRVSMRQTTESGDVSYELVIAGDTITSGNANDLTVLPSVTKNCANGYAYYDFMNHTLHLSGVDIINDESTYNGISYNSKRIDLTIMLGEEPVNVKTYNDALYFHPYSSDGSSLTITSEPGNLNMPRCQLNLVSSNYHPVSITKPIVISGQAKVTLQCGKNSRVPFWFFGEGWTMTMKENAELFIKANQYAHPIASGASDATGELILEDGIAILSPAGATWSTNILVDQEGNELTNVDLVIGKLTKYDLFVGGIQVTNVNRRDVKGDGTVTFDGDRTLTLDNATVMGSTRVHGIEANTPLVVKLVGENNVGGKWAFQLTKAGYIYGPGSLNVVGQVGIRTEALKVTIGEGAKVAVEGTAGVAIGNSGSIGGELIISGADTEVKMKGKSGAIKFSTLTLNDGLAIVSPRGAYFDSGNRNIVNANGDVILGKWVTIASPSSVPTDIETFSPETAVNSYFYTLDGQRISGKPTKKGVYVREGKKVVVK